MVEPSVDAPLVIRKLVQASATWIPPKTARTDSKTTHLIFFIMSGILFEFIQSPNISEKRRMKRENNQCL
jgi:hypothetical protein